MYEPIDVMSYTSIIQNISKFIQNIEEKEVKIKNIETILSKLIENNTNNKAEYLNNLNEKLNIIFNEVPNDIEEILKKINSEEYINDFNLLIGQFADKINIFSNQLSDLKTTLHLILPDINKLSL
jgi:vesicle coat complex subunit